jgi:hypothetical protein
LLLGERFCIPPSGRFIVSTSAPRRPLCDGNRNSAVRTSKGSARLLGWTGVVFFGDYWVRYR